MSERSAIRSVSRELRTTLLTRSALQRDIPAKAESRRGKDRKPLNVEFDSRLAFLLRVAVYAEAAVIAVVSAGEVAFDPVPVTPALPDH